MFFTTSLCLVWARVRSPKSTVWWVYETYFFLLAWWFTRLSCFDNCHKLRIYKAGTVLSWNAENIKIHALTSQFSYVHRYNHHVSLHCFTSSIRYDKWIIRTLEHKISTDLCSSLISLLRNASASLSNTISLNRINLRGQGTLSTTR